MNKNVGVVPLHDHAAHIFHKISTAPMIDWSDRHYRHFMKLLNPHLTTYSEMIVDQAIIHGDREILLAKSDLDDDCILQIGGSDPTSMAHAAKWAEKFGYAGVNINVGCPSDRVQSGCFGAVLMRQPELVAQIFTQISEGISLPVSIKCRLGVDEQNVMQTFPYFLETVTSAGCQHVVVHARKAWLNGLSPKENRNIPPLDYALPAAMKDHYGPRLCIEINGGISSLGEADVHLQQFDRVMIGRMAYHNPFGLADRGVDRSQIVYQMLGYIDRHIKIGGRAHQVLRHMHGLYHNVPGARRWRQLLSASSANYSYTAFKNFLDHQESLHV